MSKKTRKSTLHSKSDEVFEALEACMHKNFADDEVSDAKAYILHKLVWSMTCDNDATDKVLKDLGIEKR